MFKYKQQIFYKIKCTWLGAGQLLISSFFLDLHLLKGSPSTFDWYLGYHDLLIAIWSLMYAKKISLEIPKILLNKVEQSKFQNFILCAVRRSACIEYELEIFLFFQSGAALKNSLTESSRTAPCRQNISTLGRKT